MAKIVSGLTHFSQHPLAQVIVHRSARGMGGRFTRQRPEAVAFRHHVSLRNLRTPGMAIEIKNLRVVCDITTQPGNDIARTKKAKAPDVISMGKTMVADI